MTIQSSAQIGNIIRNALVFNVKNWSESPEGFQRADSMMNSNSLLQSVQDLFVILEERKIDYVLVGGIALLHYVEGRNTEDLDLLMAVSALQRLPELHVTRKDKNFAHTDFNGLQIDVLLTQNPLFARVQRKYTKTQPFLDRTIPIATVEGLLLLKFYALPSLYRQGNFARVGLYENDIATLLHYYQPQVGPLLVELAEHLNENDLAEVKSILGDIEKRIKRFKNEAHE